jgi:hypothetical protein
MLKLLEFDYQIEYKKGSENSVADPLSRKMEQAEIPQCLAISAIVPKWKSKVLQSYDKDDRSPSYFKNLHWPCQSYQFYHIWRHSKVQK